MPRSPFAPFALVFALALAPAAPARADIPFVIREAASPGWPWPAAVAQSFGTGMFSYGVLHFDVLQHRVEHLWTDGAQVVYTQPVLAGAEVERISVAVEYDAIAHACFYLENSGLPRKTGLRYATSDFGGDWTWETVAEGRGVGLENDIAVRSDVGPVIVYTDRSEGAEIKYADRSLGFWLSLTLFGGTEVREPSIATDPGPTTHVAWIGDDTLRYWRAPATPMERVAPANSVTSAAIAVDRQYRPHIAFSEKGALKIATRRGPGDWEVIRALPESWGIEGLSFAYDYMGLPYVLFVTSDPNAPPRLATLFDGAWFVQDVGTAPAMGGFHVPSLCAGLGTDPSVHLVGAWGDAGLMIAWDDFTAVAFARARLRACPRGDLTSTVRLFNTIQYPLESGVVTLDFLNGAVWDSVSFCGAFPTTLTSAIGADTNATFQFAATGTVSGGIAVRCQAYEPVTVEPSVPLANADQDGDGSVTPADRDLLVSRYGTGDPRADLDFDGDVDADDRQILLDHLWHACAQTDAGPGSRPAGEDGLALRLLQNPAVGTAGLVCRVPRTAPLRVEVCDLAGRRVRQVHDGVVGAGEWRGAWDGRDDAGRAAVSGVYLVVARDGNASVRQRLVLLR